MAALLEGSLSVTSALSPWESFSASYLHQAKSEDGADPNLSFLLHLQLPYDGQRQADNPNIERHVERS